MGKKFQKRKENFFCEHCKKLIEGNGYTNHCPYCLWSKHVDINPGDRLESCRGMMKPIKVEIKGKDFIITHQCIKCGYKKKNKAAANDDIKSYLEKHL